MIDLITTPNARLLYQQVPVSDVLGFQRWAGQLELALAKSGSARRATAALDLYFFEDPRSEDFWELGCWVGMEIIGFMVMDDYAGTDYPLQSFDLQQGEVYQLRIDANSATMEDVLELVGQARDNLQQNDFEQLAPTWRLRLDQGQMAIQLFPEF